MDYARMDWKKLLSTKRVSNYSQCDTKERKSQFNDPRSCFERDYDQIAFSYPFRRLQDKTQVIPFPKFDFVHTRLTHSLEVASVGRSFGKMAANIIIKELGEEFFKENDLSKSDIGVLIAAACLAHDIGNPPFGHSGEDAISHYFLSMISSLLKPEFKYNGKKGLKYVYHEEKGFDHEEFDLSEKDRELWKHWHDLINFEGNANGFRIITKNCDRGINPTVALLGTFTKYPRESYLLKDPFLNKNKPKSQKKYGFFQEQKDLFKFVAEELGLLKVEGIGEDDIAYRRHPLAFLMEASDDIAYGMIDFEDGCRLNLIDFEKKYKKIKLRNKKNVVKDIEVNKSPKEILVGIAKKDDSYDEEKLNSFNDYKQQISYLRSKVINVLVHLCFDVFTKEYENIMCGKFDMALMDCIEDLEIKENLKLMSCLIQKYIYQYPPVLECEAGGFEIMDTLINSLTQGTNICYSCQDDETAKEQKLRSLLPDEFQPKVEKKPEELTNKERYERIISVLDYISGMTDKYATNLYRKIKGFQVDNK